jgi:HK97 family phage portal protein
MDFLNWLWPRAVQQAPERRALNVGTLQGLVETPSRSGVAVNEQTALGVSSVWCAVNVISQSIGSLPFSLYRKGTTNELAEDHPVYQLLDVEPNRECTARVFWETFVSHALLWGNAFAECERDQAGNPLALWIIHPKNVQPDRDQTGNLVYRVRVNGIEATLYPEDVLHVPGLSPDSVAGWQLLRVARDSIGFSIATERFGQSYFSNMGNVGVYLTHPGTLSDVARDNIRRSFQSQAGGVDNTGKCHLLEEGLTARRETLSNEAGQYDETRRFQITEVSRLFNISPTKLHELGRATWGNLSTLNTDFWSTTCRPWACKIEAEVTRKLLRPEERSQVYVEFDADTLLRGDVTTRYAAYSVGITAGFLTPELVSEWEGLPPPPEEPVVEQDQAEAQQDQQDGTQDQAEAEEPTPAGGAEPLGTSNDLRATVGGSVAVADLQKAYYKGELPRDAAIANAVLIFGFSEAEANRLFPEVSPEKLTEDEPQPTQQEPTQEEANGDENQADPVQQ